MFYPIAGFFTGFLSQDCWQHCFAPISQFSLPKQFCFIRDAGNFKLSYFHARILLIKELQTAQNIKCVDFPVTSEIQNRNYFKKRSIPGHGRTILTAWVNLMSFESLDRIRESKGY